MQAGDYLALIKQMPLGAVQTLTRDSPFVILSPHPDDETLGAGGLICQACAQGEAANVIVLTDGSGSHPRSKLFPRNRLVALRQTEVETAASLLGLPCKRVHHLGLVDTQAPKSGPAFDSAVNQIMNIVKSTESKSLFVTWGYDPHCDHEAAALLAKAIRRLVPEIMLWAYPVWGWHLHPSSDIPQPEPIGFRLDVSQQLAVKRAAIAAHASQMTALITDDPDGFCFTESTLAPFLAPFEYYIEVPE